MNHHLEPKSYESENENVEQDTSADIAANEYQETADDSVRMYLHEIGKISLLTIHEERTLANKIEIVKHLREIKRAYFREHGISASSTDIVMSLPLKISQAVNLIRLLREELGLPVTDSFLSSFYDVKLRESIEGGIDPEVVENIAFKLSSSIPDTEHCIIALSLNLDLLPGPVIEIIDKRVPMSDFERIITEEDYFSSIQRNEPVINEFMDNM